MHRMIINSALVVVLIVMSFSLFKVLSSRAQEDANITKLQELLKGQQSIHNQLVSQNQYYASNDYIEKVSRDNLDLAKKGEYIVVMPSQENLGNSAKTAISSPLPQSATNSSALRQWIDLLLH